MLKCELKPYHADKIKTITLGVLTRLSKKLNIYFVHILANYLDDSIKSFQTEEYIVSPLNEYGKSKAKGEKDVLKNNIEYLIFVTNFFRSGTRYGQSFSNYIIYSLK